MWARVVVGAGLGEVWDVQWAVAVGVDLSDMVGSGSYTSGWMYALTTCMVANHFRTGSTRSYHVLGTCRYAISALLVERCSGVWAVCSEQGGSGGIHD